MNDLATKIRFEDYEKLAWRIAHKFHAGLMARGVNKFTPEDLFQEASVSFVKALNKFDPERGFKFSTYFYNAARHNLARLVNGEEVATVSLDEERTEDGAAMHEILPAREPNAEQLVSWANHREFVMARLSERTRLVVELLESPPKCVVEELKAVRAKAEHGRNSTGRVRGAPVAVDLVMVMRFLGLNQDERRDVRSELRRCFPGCIH